MELRNPINGQHTVIALNETMRLLLQAVSHCEHLLPASQGRALEQELHAVMTAHAAHLEELRDTVLFFGGSPCRKDKVFNRGGDPFKDVPVAESFLLEMIKHEQLIIRHCKKSIQELVGANEAVSVLNRVAEETTDVCNELERIVKPKAR